MARNTNKNIFQTIAERWFLAEPAFFQTYCSHHVVANGSIPCVMRAGRGRIEYHPELVASLPGVAVEEALRAEMLRILLKHPYERKPFNCSNTACTLASDCVLASYYHWRHIHVAKPTDFGLPAKQHYEWYAIQIEKQLQHNVASSFSPSDSPSSASDPSSSASDSDSPSSASDSSSSASDSSSSASGSSSSASDSSSSASDPSSSASDPSSSAPNSNAELSSGTSADNRSTSGKPTSSSLPSKAAQSELWDEDSMMQVAINELINGITSWGSIPGHIVECIVASTMARIDYRKVLAGFRASIISSRRSLTRMRPNRRTGFQNMGSLYRFRTNLLVGIDVSGSVSSETLMHVYSIVNRFFAYGIENVDVVQFDCTLGTVCNIKKAMRRVEVCGRGGTDFQPLVDFACSHAYDGLLIFTDGEAPAPHIPPHTRTRLLWVCQDDQAFAAHQPWMRKTGRVCVIYNR